MESQEFIVLYTHQKVKKSKVWQDGILKVPGIGNKAILYDDKGECLESLFLKCLEVKPGDDLESDRYIITVEEVKAADSRALTKDVIQDAPGSDAGRCFPFGRALGCRPAGLKRKLTGFQGPHQVPSKVVVMEDGKSVASAEAKKPGPGLLSAFCSSPLFPTVGKEGVDRMPTDAKKTDTCRSRARDGQPSSSSASAPSFKMSPETLCEEDHFCSPIISVNKHSDSLLTNKPMKTASLAPPCLGVSQHGRSRAQILALLKSKSAGMSKEVQAEITEHLPQGPPQAGLKIAAKPRCLIEQEECSEVRIGSWHDQRQSERTMKSGSPWAVLSSSQSSPVYSPAGGNDLERKPTAQGDKMNLHGENLWVQKGIELFATCAENGEMYNEDQLVDNNYQSGDQKVTLEITSFSESNSLPVASGSVENYGSQSESDIQENIKMLGKQNGQMCGKGSILREDAQETNRCATPGKGYKRAVSGLPGPERLQTESARHDQSSMPAALTDGFSKSSAADESLPSVRTPESNAAQAVWEVTFNLSDFEASDTEEESQESNEISQELECWIKDTLVNDCSPVLPRPWEGMSCVESGHEHRPLLTSVGKPAETLPAKETRLAQFCGQTCTGLDPGAWKAGSTREETEEEDGGSNSALEGTGGLSNEDANKSTQKVRMNYAFASLSNHSKGKTSNLHIPRFLNIAPTETPENSRPSERAQPQPSIMGNDVAKKKEQALPTGSGRDGSVPLLNAAHCHSEACVTALGQAGPQVPSSVHCPPGRKHLVFRDTEAPVSESNCSGVGTAGESTRYGPGCRNPAELPGSGSNISLLKSLSEHNTALDGLEALRRKGTASGQQGAVQSHEPESSIGGGFLSSRMAGRPWISVVPRARPTSPCLDWGSLQCSATPMMIKENEVETIEPLQSLQFFSLGSEGETAFAADLPRQAGRKACDPKPVEFHGHRVKGSASSAVMVRGWPPVGVACESCTPDSHCSVPKQPSTCMQVGFLQFSDEENFPERGTSCNIEDHFQAIAESDKDSIEKDSILDFPLKDPEHSHHHLDYDLKLAELTPLEANKVTSPEPKRSTFSPVSPVSLDSRDEGSVLELSEDSLEARTLPVMKKFSSVENKNFQRLPSVSRTRLPLITGPVDVGPRSHATGYDRRETSASPTVVCEGSVVASFSLGPEDQSKIRESGEVTSTDPSLLDHVSFQSKWLKYQNLPQCNSVAPSRVDRKVTDGFLAEVVSGLRPSDTGQCQGDAVGSPLDAVHLQMIKSMLCQRQLHFSSQGLICRKQAVSLNVKQTSKTEESPNMSGEPACCERSVTGGPQEISVSELCFPSGQKRKSFHLPQRHMRIPATFPSPAHYRQTFAACLREHLNILLFGLAQRLDKALSKVDISFYTSSKGEKLKNLENNVPSCHHLQPAKLVMVKKEGPNKGRLFYTCDASKTDRCKFFKWLEEVTPGNLTQEASPPTLVLSDIKSIGLYLRSQTIPLYEECHLLMRRGFDFQRKQYGKLKKFTTVNPEFYSEPHSKLYLKLSRKESSLTYSKDDLWVISKTLDFELDTFIACSAFFGPSSTNELEILPLRGYCPSHWSTSTVVHALLVCNASTELTTLKNIEDHFHPATLPIMWHLLTLSPSTTGSSRRASTRKFIPPALSLIHTNLAVPSLGETLQVAGELIQAHTLNPEQAAALTQIAHMMASHDGAAEARGPQVPPITIIQGVFGAGKSHLLAVVILFFVQLFEKSEAPTVGNSRQWKLLISSSTNVAVDRVLLGLLSLGFEKFVRVGSVRKIAKPILPYSLHAGSENANEQLKELQALMKEDLTPMERAHVRKSIEQHKLGTNRTLLKQVRVVGVTCAACPFPCMNDLKFPVVVLDECSQMTEPAALLPIARFECEKLILVGDPRQLPPVQASKAAHEHGLEQTLFDRLCLMGHKPVLLRTQYRCHPAISAVANDLFYGGNLRDGVSGAERSPLLAWLPTLCFYHVPGVEQIERGNSFHNVAEAAFTLKLIQSLIASGVAGCEIGVITLYKAQMYKLCHSLSAVGLDPPDVRAVQVSTVDAFQGAEKEIVILSCVRTRQVGFIDSEKRMNVALTRGRRHLLIVGNAASLRKNHLWGRVIQHCEGREDGLQHASQCEPQLDHFLRDYFEKQAEEKQKKKTNVKINLIYKKKEYILLVDNLQNIQEMTTEMRKVQEMTAQSSSLLTLVSLLTTCVGETSVVKFRRYSHRSVYSTVENGQGPVIVDTSELLTDYNTSLQAIADSSPSQ